MNKMEGNSGSKLKYEHPLIDRYSSKEMNFIWSPAKKISTWRRLWLALAVNFRVHNRKT
jgi:hypothetical protein